MSVDSTASKGMLASVKADAGTAAWRTLDYMPVGLFGSVMGLTGLSVAWRLAHARFGVSDWVAESVGAAAVLAFVALALGYGVKLVTAPQEVARNMNIRSPAIFSARSSSVSCCYRSSCNRFRSHSPGSLGS